MKSKRSSSIFSSFAVIIISLLLIQSCTKTPSPAFTYEPSTNPEAGDSIKFTNSSMDATSYSWDFGDTYSSRDENPSNIYVEAGAYTVTLTASNDKKSEMISEEITINEPTALGIFVVEDDEETAIGECSVWVYDNESDWEDSNDPQYEATADSDGFALFMNLEAQEYIVDIYGETETGYWYGAYLLEALDLNESNLFLLALTFFPDSKKSSERRDDLKSSPIPVQKMTK